jgi:hypothetical protein
VAKLPNIDAVIVEDAKLTEYLLNPAHPRGAAKANFLARFGFSAERPEQAREAFPGACPAIRFLGLPTSEVRGYI